MNPFIQSKLPEIKRVLQQHDVKSAYLFGSAVTEQFNDESDVDFLIEFNDTEPDPAKRGANSWSLYDSLKDLLLREVDVVNAKYLRNPYFIEELNETKQSIYGA